MSLEQELARNTEAMIALTAALTARTVVVETPTEKMSQALAKVKPPKLVAVVVTSPETSPPVGSSPGTDSTTTVSETSVTTPTIDYATVANAITSTFKVDRVKTIEALAKFGAAKGPQLKPADYAAFLAELAA